MKLTSIQKMIIVAALVVVVAAMVVGFLILPQFTELSDLQVRKAEADDRVAQANAVLAGLRSAKGRAAVTEAELLKIGTQMPDSPQLPSLIIELQDIANSSGVKVSSISPGQPAVADGGKYTEISLSTVLTADWEDLLDYLKRLDRSTRLLRVTALAITPPAASVSTATPEPSELGVSMTMKAYVIGDNGVVGSNVPTPTAGTP